MGYNRNDHRFTINKQQTIITMITMAILPMAYLQWQPQLCTLSQQPAVNYEKASCLPFIKVTSYVSTHILWLLQVHSQIINS